MAGAIVSELQKDPSQSHFHMFCWKRNVENAVDATFQNQLPGRYGCYVVTSISSNFEDTLDATFKQPFQSTSRTLWMLPCNIHFEQLRRCFGCYVPTAISINFQHAMDACIWQQTGVACLCADHVCSSVDPVLPPKGSPESPLNVPLCPSFSLKRFSNILNREASLDMPPSPP